MLFRLFQPTMIAGMLFATTAFAAAIGPDVFINPIVVTYDGLGLNNGGNPTPLVIAGDTYTTNDSQLNYAAFGFCSFWGGNECIGDNTEFGYIDIVLGSPALRVGVNVGASTSTVSFYDQTDQLLGSLPGPHNGLHLSFVGWQADGGLIGRVRVADTEANSQMVLLDDLTKETTTPEPATATLVALALGISAARRLMSICAR